MAASQGRSRGGTTRARAGSEPARGLVAGGAGHRVATFAHVEVVIELPEDADHAAEATRVESIMNYAMGRVAGDVPVAREYAPARRRSKEAKAIFDAVRRLVPRDEAPSSRRRSGGSVASRACDRSCPITPFGGDSDEK